MISPRETPLGLSAGGELWPSLAAAPAPRVGCFWSRERRLPSKRPLATPQHEQFQDFRLQLCTERWEGRCSCALPLTRRGCRTCTLHSALEPSRDWGLQRRQRIHSVGGPRGKGEKGRRMHSPGSPWVHIRRARLEQGCAREGGGHGLQGWQENPGGQV